MSNGKMASPEENISKDLKNVVAASYQDLDAMQTNLEKLRNLSKDDRNEAAMLRSRIEEQSQLICILKQRADNATIRIQTLEKVNKDLENFREKANDLLREEIQKAKMMDRRFNELAENHEEMIKIKDEYKNQNEELRQENSRLKDENSQLFCTALKERDANIDSMGKHITSLKDQCKEYQSVISSLKDDLLQKEKWYEAEIKKLKKTLKKSEENLKVITTEFTKFKDNVRGTEQDKSVQLEKVTKERQEFLDLAMQRGKLIQDKQKEIILLQGKVREAEKEVEQKEAKFEREAAAVSANIRVIKLKGERDEAETALKDLRMEYEAFKKHTNSLLTKEKNLNAKLRNLVT